MDELFDTKIKENATESRLPNVRISASDASVLTRIRTSTWSLKTSFFGNPVFSVQLGEDENRMRTEVSLYKFLGKDVIIKKIFG